MKEILKAEERAVFALRSLYHSRGYRPYKMSRFEAYDLYVANRDFLQSHRVITFPDAGGRLLALKPDVTLSIIKNAAREPGQILKVYYNENVYRGDSGVQGFREMLQTGLECVGDLGAYEIAEVAYLAAKSLELLGNEFVLNLSHVGFVGAVLEQSGLSPEGRQSALELLRQKNGHEIRSLCREENLEAGQEYLLRTLAESSGTPETVLALLEPMIADSRALALLEELRRICELLIRRGFGGKIRLDFSVGNEMKYYSGLVFKGYLEGIPVAVLSGGSYDRLLENMGKTGRAIGFAVHLNLLERRQAYGDDVDVLLLHDGAEDPETVMAAVESLQQEGSVLAAVEPPAERLWKKTVRLEKGELKWLETEC